MSKLVEGTYRARAVSHELGQMDDGSERVQVVFQVTDGPFTGETITWFGGFKSEKQTPFTVKALRAAGMRNDDIEDVKGLGDVECMIVLENNEYEGKTTLRVQYVNAVGGAGFKNKLQGAGLKSLSARLKGAFLAEPPAPVVPAQRPWPGAKPVQMAATGTDENGSEDDIPF